MQGFVKYILKKVIRNVGTKCWPISGIFMEYAIDMVWVNAQISHAIMLCEIDRGSLSWFDTDQIDQIRRDHARRHSVPTKQI